jgi:YD repeat-containing protein
MKQALVGHPVDVVTGSVFTAWTDFSFKGPAELVWRRFYSTGNAEVGAHGRGWTGKHFVRLEQRGSRLLLIGDEGHAHAFERPAAAGLASTIARHPWALSEEDGGWRVFDRQLQKTLHFTPSETEAGTYRLSRVEDLSGVGLLLHRDPQERLIGLEQPSLQRLVRLKYGRLGTIESAELRVPGHEPQTLASFAYDRHANLIGATDPEGGTIHYVYDDEHRMIAERNQLGGCFHFEYDSQGRCVHTWGDGGYLERHLAFQPGGRSTLVTDGLGAVTRFDSGPDGHIVRKVDALGRERKYFHAQGIEQSIAPDGTLSESEVDARGDLVRKTDELGRSFEFTYDDHAQITAIVDPGGALWSRESTNAAC